MESINQDLGAIDSSCLKWHMKLYSKKTKYMVVRRSPISAHGYGDLTLGGAELEEINGLRKLAVTLV